MTLLGRERWTVPALAAKRNERAVFLLRPGRFSSIVEETNDPASSLAICFRLTDLRLTARPTHVTMMTHGPATERDDASSIG